MKYLFFTLIGFLFTPISSNSQTKPSDEELVFSVVEQEPEFQGGNDMMIEYMSRNLKFTEEFKKNAPKGNYRCFVEFIVRKDGSLDGIKTVRSIGYGMDENCMDVIKRMPKWKPGKQNGKLVSVKFMIPILVKQE
jgi:periplasmic protein TonB